MSGFSPKVLHALKERSGGVCEGCGLRWATEAHHRQYRSRGGLETLDNALHLCGWGNHTGCHGVAHTAEGEARGWSVRSGYSTLNVPVLLPSGWAHMPSLEPMPAADAIEFMQLIHAIKAVA